MKWKYTNTHEVEEIIKSLKTKDSCVLNHWKLRIHVDMMK
jgi:hypothetical protein